MKAAAAIGAAAVLASGVSPAQAATPATHLGTLYLYQNPSGSNGAWSCITDRSIYLDQHEYAWNQMLQGNPVDVRNIELAAGWYTWSDCMIPIVSANTGLWTYSEFSALTNSSGGEAQMEIKMPLSANGDYQIGSELTEE